MPRTTVRHPFEWKMLEATVRLAGRDDLTVLARPDAPIQTSPIGQTTLRELADRLSVHLFYDPFDPFEYRWLSWKGLSRADAERWLGVRFEAKDFGDQKEFP